MSMSCSFYSINSILLMAFTSELITQFTEDAFADRDCTCERPSCTTKIHKGDPCFYIATMVPGKAGRFVCRPCNHHYELKLATGVRPTSGHAPNPRIIRQSVNAAQRSCLSLLSLTHLLSLTFPSIHASTSCHRNILWTQGRTKCDHPF